MSILRPEVNVRIARRPRQRRAPASPLAITDAMGGRLDRLVPEPEPVLLRVQEPVDHRADITSLQYLQPRLITCWLWFTSQVAIVLHSNKSVIELSTVHLITVGNGTENLRPRQRIAVQLGDQINAG